MTSKDTQGWRGLQRSSPSECPKVFYNLDCSNDGLRLLLTDLLGIWECALTKPDVLKAAEEQASSIDPSESSEQFRILLQKLEQGIKSDQNVLYRQQSDRSENLHLRTFVQLPKPLQPLAWTFKLIPQNATELGEQLLRPCLFEASLSRQKLSSLQQVIKDKDHVIARLLERLESSNTDLSLIFPGVKSRRGRVTVAEAEKHIPGMAAFDVTTWSSYFDTKNPYANYDNRGFENLVSGCQECPKHTVREHADWYKHLPDRVNMSTEKRMAIKSESEPLKIVNPDPEDYSSTSEDEFERQQTPPNLQERSARPSNDGIPVNVPAKIKQSPNSTSSSPRLAERSAHRHSPSPAPHHQQVEQPKPDTKPDVDNVETSSGEDNDLDAPSRRPPRPRTRSASSTSSGESQQRSLEQPKRKLGSLKKRPGHERNTRSPSPSTGQQAPKRRLGALKKSANESHPGHNQPSQPSVHKDSSPSSNAPPPRRLGRLGKKPTDDTSYDKASLNDQVSTALKSAVNAGQDSDATESASASPSPDPDTRHQSTSKPNAKSHAYRSQPIKSEEQDDAVLMSTPDTIEQTVELTAEQKADLRREELKRKVDVSSGTRKKRKF